ncbi:MAG: orotidine-5'-phosphate decarboxylase [Bacillota bacterium]
MEKISRAVIIILEPNQRIICALDVTDPGEARRIVGELDGLVDFFKVGMLLYLVDGRKIVQWLLEQGKKVFLDLKFYDVPDTVGPAVSRVAASGVHLLTVHGNREILKRAGEAAAGTGLQVLAVTALTSLDVTDIREMGFACSVEELVLQRAKWAMKYGCAGVIASPREAALVRARCGKELLIVTPGIRLVGGDLGTHKRAASPGEAVAAGADYLVVGQPIIKSGDPRAAARQIAGEIRTGK